MKFVILASNCSNMLTLYTQRKKNFKSITFSPIIFTTKHNENKICLPLSKLIYVTKEKSHLTNDRYQSDYTCVIIKRLDNVFNVLSESCWTSYLSALDLESRTRSVDRPLPEEKPIQEIGTAAKKFAVQIETVIGSVGLPRSTDPHRSRS